HIMAIETIRYAVGSETFASEVIWDESKSGKRPILLVAPNWFGVTPQWTGRSEAAAAANAQRADTPEWRRRMAAALEHAVREGDRRGIADTSKRAAIG